MVFSFFLSLQKYFPSWRWWWRSWWPGWVSVWKRSSWCAFCTFSLVFSFRFTELISFSAFPKADIVEIRKERKNKVSIFLSRFPLAIVNVRSRIPSYISCCDLTCLDMKCEWVEKRSERKCVCTREKRAREGEGEGLTSLIPPCLLVYYSILLITPIIIIMCKQMRDAINEYQNYLFYVNTKSQRKTTLREMTSKPVRQPNHH